MLVAHTTRRKLSDDASILERDEILRAPKLAIEQA
jgi:hypothetical protein